MRIHAHGSFCAYQSSSSDAGSFVKNLSCQCLKPWQGSQQEVPESHEAEPKEETEKMKAVKDTISKREK